MFICPELQLNKLSTAAQVEKTDESQEKDQWYYKKSQLKPDKVREEGNNEK
jgi:hypothetical protein